jgi:hypothetical protein
MTKTRKTSSETSSAPADAAETLEIDAIVQHFHNGVESDNRAAIYNLLDGQLSVIHGRAQSLMQIAGVVITVTGFSGRIIADTNALAQTLIVTGLAMVACAAAIALVFVMPIRWVSGYMHLPLRDWILVTLRRRHKKSRAIRISSAIMAIGMILYIVSIAIMLLNPQAAELKMVR